MCFRGVFNFIVAGWMWQPKRQAIDFHKDEAMEFSDLIIGAAVYVSIAATFLTIDSRKNNVQRR